jgi:hypothetical protein
MYNLRRKKADGTPDGVILFVILHLRNIDIRIRGHFPL